MLSYKCWGGEQINLWENPTVTVLWAQVELQIRSAKAEGNYSETEAEYDRPRLA